MPVSELQYRMLALVPTATMALVAAAVVGVIVFAILALRRALGPGDASPSEIAPLDKRFAAGRMSLHEYEQEKEKFLQAH